MSEPVQSARDILLFELNEADQSLREMIADINEDEYNWEPTSNIDRAADLLLPAEGKRVWRVFLSKAGWTYDYTPERLQPPPFTTIAWILNHVAQTADMYLYCIQSGEAEGIRRHWEDLPVPSSLFEMSDYLFTVIARVREYIVSISENQVARELNKRTPAPWGEMRTTYRNLWGGVIEHMIQHTMQIAARKDHIRYGY